MEAKGINCISKKENTLKIKIGDWKILGLLYAGVEALPYPVRDSSNQKWVEEDHTRALQGCQLINARHTL